jgi:hypothetical protein
VFAQLFTSVENAILTCVSAVVLDGLGVFHGLDGYMDDGQYGLFSFLY